jgi:glutamyl-tRNA reductase
LQCRAMGNRMQQLFSQVFAIAKKVRSKTKIGENNLSVSYAAIKLAERIFSTLAGRSAMIIGAGEMGELTVRNLISHGVSTVYVTNRTFQRAVELAERFKGIPVMFHEIYDYLPSTDVLISSVTVSEHIIRKERFESVTQKKNGKPLFIIDISVPRSVDPAVGAIPNVHLLNIDDLYSVVDANSESRKKEVEKAVRIIDEKIPEILRNFNSFDIVRVMASIREFAETERKQAGDTFSSAYGADKELVDQMTKSLMNRVMHYATETLRDYENSANRQNIS